MTSIEQSPISRKRKTRKDTLLDKLEAYLRQNAGRPVPHQEIVERAWGRPYLPSDDRHIRNYITALRRKHGDTAQAQRIIRTYQVWRRVSWDKPYGYEWQEDAL